jgi:hypothetical protein
VVIIKFESKNKKECMEKISKEKILPHKSLNILKDIEFDIEILKNEICNTIID